MAPLLRIENLAVRFPGLDAVHGLDLSLNEGEILALVGESGSGKSVTAGAIMGLAPASATISGSIRFAGHDLLSLPADEMRRLRGREISMIFQEPMTSFNPVMTIGRQIAEVIRLHEKVTPKAARARAIDLLGQVRLAEPGRHVDAYPHQLSGGMRQRAMIAMAIACRPRILIADEPTTALDVTVQAQVLELLDDLRRRSGMAVLLISHDLEVVRRWADRLIVLYAGHRVEEGAAAAVLDRPAHPYTRHLLAASPLRSRALHYTQGRLQEMPGTRPSGPVADPGCAFAPRCPLALAACRAALPPMRRIADGQGIACIVESAGSVTR